MGRKKKFEEVISIRFPKHVLEGIDEIAKKESKNRSDVVREIVTSIIMAKDPALQKLFEKKLGPPFEFFFKKMFRELPKEEIEKLNKEIKELFEKEILRSQEMEETIKKYYPEYISKKKSKK